LLGLGSLDLPTRSQSLVSKNADHLDLRTLTASLAEFEDLEIPGAGFAVFILRAQLFCFGTPEDELFADVLDWSSGQLLAHLGEHALALAAIIAKDAYLDETVRAQGCIGFLQDRGGQAVRTNHHNRVKVVGLGTKVLAFSGGKKESSHHRIIVAARHTDEN
jgi:hypothetical protein